MRQRLDRRQSLPGHPEGSQFRKPETTIGAVLDDVMEHRNRPMEIVLKAGHDPERMLDVGRTSLVDLTIMRRPRDRDSPVSSERLRTGRMRLGSHDNLKS